MSFELNAGATIGGAYRVTGVLGRGGMGVVLRARDEQLARDVAVKLVRPDLVRDGLRERFCTEARAMARVCHPNVLPIYSFGEHEGAPYFVTRIVRGPTVEAWLSDQGRRALPDLDAALQILDDTCRGLEAIHVAGAVHRDIKPSNLLLDPELGACVADFGVAWLSGETNGGGEVVGTPDYMAPECVLHTDGSDLTPRADVYSLGCVAFELLTGAPPFHRMRNSLARMVAQATDAPPTPSRIRPGLEAFDEVILAALVKDPAKRTPTAESFRRGLLAARREAGQPASVLIADDDEDCRELLAIALRAEFPDARIEAVSDGEAAYAAFGASTPSVVVVDLHMPNMDGMMLTQRLRRDLRTSHVPIIVLTGAGGAREWKHLVELGADGFLVKPVDPRDVATLVRRVLVDRGRRLLQATSAAPRPILESETVREGSGGQGPAPKDDEAEPLPRAG